MARIDLYKLRKKLGISQNELAQQLQVTQSFLSAVENGKSPFPPEKISRLLEVLNLDDISEYITDDSTTDDSKKMSEMTDSDLFNQLLQRFHKQAHSHEKHDHHQDHHYRIEALEQKLEAMYLRNESLMARNDRLSADNDKLRAENDNLRTTADSLRKEIDSLRTTIFNLRSQDPKA